MKKIGKETLLLGCGENNPRNGEGAFIRLNDGRILYAFARFDGDGGNDHHSAYIAACYSSDEGETWSEPTLFFEKPKDALNIMCVTFMRMANGDLGFFYLKNLERDGSIICMPMLHRSSDEGKTFDEGIGIISEPSFYVLNNDRVIRLASGRIIFAIAKHGKCKDVNGSLIIEPGVVEVYYSDDDGRSFVKSPDVLTSPINDKEGFLEPGVMELPDGRVWLYIRTGYGYQYQSFSSDGGESWSAAAPNYKLPSPSSPMLVKSVGKLALAIFNPNPFSNTFATRAMCGNPRFVRTPFVAAVSFDGGLSFVEQDFSAKCGEFLPYIKDCYYVEDNLDESYCYPSVMEVEGGFLVAYYYSNGSGKDLNSARITKVTFDELELSKE